MCGFLGEISTQLIENQRFKKLLDLGINRGPDQQGFWSDEYCQLGFNRLSIIDLSENGKQPYTSPNGKFALVFNGEVYNYKELQAKYNIADADLRSGSDTEILSHLLEKLSINDFAAELNGMFAIAVWDIEQKTAHLIRDFAGIKPLFYGIHKNGIVFASQFDQIFCHPAFENKKLRPEIMKEYFGLGYMHAPNTVFENIYQIEPAQIISYSFDLKAITKKIKYYHWKNNPTIDETNPILIDNFKTVFTDVIKSQLNADVPLSTFLSGGIDSPLVTAFSKIDKPNIKAFSFGIDDKDFDESIIAQKIAQQLEVENHLEMSSEEGILSIIDKHFDGLCEPFGDYSSLPTYLITQKAREHATVMLSGDGGDELFWGYNRYLKSIEHLFWFQMPVFVRKIIIPVNRKFYKNTSSAVEHFEKFEDWILYKQIHFKNLDEMMPNLNFSPELYEVYKFDKKIDKKNALIYLKENEFFAHMQKILRKVDLMSMANSLEVRVPFLDKKTIEFSNTINPKYGIDHQTTKLVLKKTLAKFVDESITKLPKKGFSVPIEKWLKNSLKNNVLETILNQKFYGEEHLDKKILEEIITDFYDNKRGNPWGIWHLYTWQKWAIKYNLK